MQAAIGLRVLVEDGHGVALGFDDPSQAGPDSAAADDDHVHEARRYMSTPAPPWSAPQRVRLTSALPTP